MAKDMKYKEEFSLHNIKPILYITAKINRRKETVIKIKG